MRLEQRWAVKCHHAATWGRIFGCVGAACAALLWGVALFALIRLLLQPFGVRPFVHFVAIPIGAFATAMFVISIADLIVLARRVDIAIPWTVAVMHFAIGLGLIFIGHFEGNILRAIAVPLAIAATQVIALRLFQMTPSHPSSQR